MSLELRETSNRGPESLPTISGMGVVYNSPSEKLPWVETYAEGCFSNLMEEDVLANVDHDNSRILGRSRNGTVRMEKRANGIYFEIEPPDTTYARDVIARIKRGDVAGLSAGFLVHDDEWLFENETTRRIIKRATLLEIAVATIPAYPDTNVALRALNAHRSKDRDKRNRELALMGKKYVRT